MAFYTKLLFVLGVLSIGRAQIQNSTVPIPTTVTVVDVRDSSLAVNASSTLISPVVDNDMCSQCTCPNSESSEGQVACNGKALRAMPTWPDWLLLYPGNLSLNLDFNHLNSVVAFPNVSHLQSISIGHNQVSSVSVKALASLPRLKILKLNNNRLIRIDRLTFDASSANDHAAAAAAALPLEYLDLSYNLLHSVDKSAFDALPNLRTLLLNDNPLKALDTSTQTALNALSRLSTLSLAQTHLAQLPDQLVNPVRHLDVLNLDGNLLDTVPQVLRHADALRALGLNDNPIATLNLGDFEGLAKLETLNVSSMPQLTSIKSGAFSPLENLVSLHCSHNPKLTNISANAFKNNDRVAGKQLFQVSFRENKLETLDKTLLPWSTIRWVDLSDNPWRCDCRIRWMKKLHMTADYSNFLRCHEPEEARNQNVMTVADDIMARCPTDVRPVSVQSTTAEDTPSKVIIIGIICIGILFIALAIYLVHLLAKRRWRRKNAFHTRMSYTKTQNNDYFE